MRSELAPRSCVVALDDELDARDARSVLLSLGRGVRRRGRMFFFVPAIPNPFVWEHVVCAPLSTEACAA